MSSDKISVIYKITEEVNRGTEESPDWQKDEPWYTHISPLRSGTGTLQKNHIVRLQVEVATIHDLYEAWKDLTKWASLSHTEQIESMIKPGF